MSGRSATRAKRRVRAPSRKQRRTIYLATAVAAVLVCVANVWGASYAAFTATTANPSSTFGSGNVSVSANQNGTAVFYANDITPGSKTTCVIVTYTGNLAASVKLYATNSTGDIGPYLNLTIDLGSGSNADCSDFTSPVNAYSGTLGNFASTSTNFATGVGSFTPSTNGDTKTYRLTYNLQNSTGAQNRTGTVTLNWEAQST